MTLELKLSLLPPARPPPPPREDRTFPTQSASSSCSIFSTSAPDMAFSFPLHRPMFLPVGAEKLSERCLPSLRLFPCPPPPPPRRHLPDPHPCLGHTE